MKVITLWNMEPEGGDVQALARESPAYTGLGTSALKGGLDCKGPS